MSGTVIDAFAAELAAWSTSKGTIRFTHETPLPADLVRRIVAARQVEDGVVDARLGPGVEDH